MRLRAAIVHVVPQRQRNLIKRNIARCFASHLDWLARFYLTDKSSRRLAYTRFYRRFLEDRRRTVQSVLEIGVGHGSSLRMWRDYFPRAQIVGIDVLPTDLGEPRIRTFQGDQTDGGFLSRVADAAGPFDLIVDDGSHQAGHAAISFDVLFRHLKPGGLYAIEDLVTSYQEDYGGGPPGTEGTAVALVKELTDAVQVRSLEIAALHVYDGIAVIERARSADVDR